MEYHKINSLYKRDGSGKFTYEFSRPEFEYLYYNVWQCTEKIDGTNIRAIFTNNTDPDIKGKTDKANLLPGLVSRINELLPQDKLKSVIDFNEDTVVTLFGEGVGKKIQNGAKYVDGIGQDFDFILFDILVNRWWLNRNDVEEIAKKLGIRYAPVVFEGTLELAISSVKTGFMSTFGNFIAEGVVARPRVEMFNRAGERVITKLKVKDFNK